MDILEINKEKITASYCDMDMVVCNIMKAADKEGRGS